MLGDGLAILAIPLLVMQLTRSPLAAVLASLPGSAGYLAAGLPAGVLADRVSPWLVLITGDVIRALIFFTLFLLTGSHAVVPALILSLAFAAGAVTVFSDTALAIAVRDVFTGPRLISANSWLESANQGGMIIGPSAAGLLAAAGLLHEAMLIDALTFLVSLASLAGVRRHYAPARDRGTQGRGLAGAGPGTGRGDQVPGRDPAPADAAGLHADIEPLPGRRQARSSSSARTPCTCHRARLASSSPRAASAGWQARRAPDGCAAGSRPCRSSRCAARAPGWPWS